MKYRIIARQGHGVVESVRGKDLRIFGIGQVGVAVAQTPVADDDCNIFVARLLKGSRFAFELECHDMLLEFEHGSAGPGCDAVIDEVRGRFGDENRGGSKLFEPFMEHLHRRRLAGAWSARDRNNLHPVSPFAVYLKTL